MKEQILSCLGRFPSKAPLKLQRGEKREKDGYTIEKISYQTEPNERVNSLLLCPQKLRVPAPAVLAIHQHAAQCTWASLNRRGWQGTPCIITGPIWPNEAMSCCARICSALKSGFQRCLIIQTRKEKPMSVLSFVDG